MARFLDFNTASPTKYTAQPLLSICITTYNREKWLALNVKTLKRWIEPFKDTVEIVVCDNTSTDNTRDAVAPYLRLQYFHYYRNPKNVGMLGNLEVTAHHARGKYVWIIGDDDIIKEGTIDVVLGAIRQYPNVSLIYLNYGYTRVSDATQVKDIDKLLANSTAIVPASPNQYSKIKEISTKNENFFTAIYCLIFRHDHALRAYSQNTKGRPFSTLLTCIPTSYYVCNHMFEEMGLWIGDPAVVVNMNVSWLKYATLWVLERLPELYDLSEIKGANPNEMDKWRTYNFEGVIHYLNEIYDNDEENNLPYFSIDRLIQRHKHLQIFKENLRVIMDMYQRAYSLEHDDDWPLPETLRKRYNLSV